VSGPDTLIRIEGVGQAFGAPGDPRRVVALESTSFDITRGELVCLIGPSGCGKSTLLNIIGGLATPASGSVTIDGQPVRGPSPQKIAYVFQDNTLFPWRTVVDNVKLGMAFQGVPKAEHDARARESLKAVGLSDFADHYPAQLSGGMRQRAQLARALGLRTEILLMDEPFAALDEQTRLILGEDLSVLLARTGKTIVFVTHSLVEAVFLADRVAVFTARPGKIKKIINVDESHPRKSNFMTSPKLSALRNELYELLHDEIRMTMAQADDAGAGT
jgi:NitT/TauT family transport system ATP-binding protein